MFLKGQIKSFFCCGENWCRCQERGNTRFIFSFALASKRLQTLLCLSGYGCFTFLWWISGSEVTKVRRNLFNQELVSPSKKAKMPRSRSVSAMEGLKHKCQETEGAASQIHQLILPVTQQQKYTKHIEDLVLSSFLE